MCEREHERLRKMEWILAAIHRHKKKRRRVGRK